MAHAGGRPTAYNPEWIDMLPDMFREGQSVLEVAVKLGISRASYYNFEKEYPEFLDASTRGKEISQAWWEEVGRTNLTDIAEYQGTSYKFNDRLWNKNVSCRFRNDWTDKSEIEHSGHVTIIDDIPKK